MRSSIGLGTIGKDDMPTPQLPFESDNSGEPKDDIQDIVLSLSSISAKLVKIAGSSKYELYSKQRDHSPAGDIGTNRRDLSRFARSLYRGRMNRAKSITSHLFGEPGWDMLLHLYSHASEGREISTKSLCLASGAPQTTALRWIGQMESAGLVERSSHAHDCRVTVIRLTPAGDAAIHECLDNLWVELRAAFATVSSEQS